LRLIHNSCIRWCVILSEVAEIIRVFNQLPFIIDIRMKNMISLSFSTNIWQNYEQVQVSCQ
jgi:hypothetical protein